MGPYYQAFPEGGSIKIFADDAKRNYEEIAKWSKKDAEAMPKWDAWIAGLADVLGPLLLTVPPKIGSRKPADLKDTLRLAWRQRGLDVRTVADVTRLMTMSIADLLDDWFESWQVKAPIAVNGVIGTWAGPAEPGTAYVMAHHSIGDIGDGHLGNWGFPEGGMGAVADAIERSARSFGAEIRTDARVARTLVRPGPGPWGRPGERRGDPRPGGRDHAPPADGLPRPHQPERAARRLRPGHRALEDPQRRGQDQPGPVRAPQLHRRPGHRAGRAPHRLGGDGPVHRVHGAGLPGRPRGPRRRAAVQRRRHPDHASTRRCAPTGPTSCRCSPSGSRRSGASRRTPRSSRPTPTG